MKTSEAIQRLPKYRRIPGEYFVIRLGVTAQFEHAATILHELGIESMVYTRNFTAESLKIYPSQYRHARLNKGDVLTFRRRRNGKGWSVISYTAEEFDCRYREKPPPDLDQMYGTPPRSKPCLD